MNESIREAMRAAMKDKGLTQQALADRIGITQGMVTQYLNGHRGKPADSLQKMLDELDLELIVKPKKTN